MSDSSGASGGSSLGIEYRQKVFCASLVDKFLSLAEEPRARSRKEATNIIDRWILSLQQSCDRRVDPHLPLFPKLAPDDPLTKQLANDAMEKGFCTLRRSAGNLGARILKEVERFRLRCHDETEPEAPTPTLVMADADRGQVCVGEFSSAVSYRLPYLAGRYGLGAAATMMLRYEALGCGSYQWGDPTSVHRVYYADFGARYEGFSSPLNSRFLGLDGARFCSLFADTDAVFGSLGNFFGIDLAEHQGGWSVNPPFIESVLELSAAKVVSSLEAGCRSWYFMNFPDWRDSRGWRLLDESPYKVNRFDFAPGEFLIQDAYGQSTRPKMKLSIFVVGHLPAGSPPPSRVADAVFKARPPADSGDISERGERRIF